MIGDGFAVHFPVATRGIMRTPFFFFFFLMHCHLIFLCKVSPRQGLIVNEENPPLATLCETDIASKLSITAYQIRQTVLRIFLATTGLLAGQCYRFFLSAGLQNLMCHHLICCAKLHQLQLPSTLQLNPISKIYNLTAMRLQPHPISKIYNQEVLLKGTPQHHHF